MKINEDIPWRAIIRACNIHEELLEALQLCSTDPTAMACLNPSKYAIKRLAEINRIVREALELAQED